MKNIVLLIPTIFIVFFLGACKKDDTSPEINTSQEISETQEIDETQEIGTIPNDISCIYYGSTYLSDTISWVGDTTIFYTEVNLDLFNNPKAIFEGNIEATVIEASDSSYYIIVPETTSGKLFVYFGDSTYQYNYFIKKRSCELYEGLVISNAEIVSVNSSDGIDYKYDITNTSSYVIDFFVRLPEGGYEGFILQKYVSPTIDRKDWIAAGGSVLAGLTDIKPGETRTVESNENDINNYLVLQFYGLGKEDCESENIILRVNP